MAKLKRNVHAPKLYGKEKLAISDFTLSTGFTTTPFRTFVYVLLFITSLCVLLTFQLHRFARQVDSMNSLENHNSFLSTRHRTPVTEPTSFLRNGTAIVAACQNGHEALRNSILSWLRVENVNEIIVVDWSSVPPLQYVIEELDLPQEKSQPAVTVATVENESMWSPSRAYNVAFRIAKSANVLRVDCDQIIQPFFSFRHMLRDNSFFAGRDGLSRSQDEAHLKNVLFASRSAVLSVGSYDERIQTFGGEQEDIVRRMNEHGLIQKDLDYNSFLHYTHENPELLSAKDGLFEGVFEESLQYRKDLECVERNVNLNLISHLPSWNVTPADDASFKSDIMRNVTVPSFRHTNVTYVKFNITRRVQSLRSIASKSFVELQTGKAMTEFLLSRYFVPRCLLGFLNLAGQKSMLYMFSHMTELQGKDPPPRALFVFLTGDLPTRLTLLASTLSFASQTGRIVIAYWLLANGARSIETTSFKSLFVEDKSLITFENIPESVLPMKMLCRQELKGTPTLFFSFFDSDERQQPLKAIDATHHIAVEGDTMIYSDNLQLSNDKVIRSHILDLEIKSDIVSNLQFLEDSHLSRAVGIYVPPFGSLGVNNTELMQYYAAVHLYLSSIRERVNNDVYLASDPLFRERLNALGVTLLPGMPLPSECDTRNGKKVSMCFKYELSQILALSRTASFYSPVDDRFTRFIRLMRNEN